jgi:alpha-tubulin suppressor-like RCC1 family protein
MKRGRVTSENVLIDLPPHVFISICVDHNLSVFDLGCLENTASHFRRRTVTLAGFGQREATLLDRAAEILLGAHEHAWRVTPRLHESVVYLLYSLEHRLWPLQHLSAGPNHNLVISQKRLFAFGADDRCQLGLGEEDSVVRKPCSSQQYRTPGNSNKNSPQLVKFDADLEPVSVSASTFCSTCIVGHGTLYTWGAFMTGQIGVDKASLDVSGLSNPWEDINLVCVARPISSGFSQSVSIVAAGDCHTACVTASGELYTWGSDRRWGRPGTNRGSSGRLGHGDIAAVDGGMVFTPRRVEAMSKFRTVGVTAGHESTAAVTDRAELFMSGNLPSGTGPMKPLECKLVLTPERVEMPNGVGVLYISSGGGNEGRCEYWAAVGTDGKIYTWGENHHGCLGHAEYSDEHEPLVSGEATPKLLDMFPHHVRFKTVECGTGTYDWHTAAVTTDGALWTWGNNGDEHCGKLGRLLKTYHSQGLPRPVHISENFFAGGDDDEARAVKAVSCGQNHMLFVLEGGSFCSVGENLNGQLGIGTTQQEDDYSGEFSGMDYGDPFVFEPHPWDVHACGTRRYYYHVYTTQSTLRRPAEAWLLNDKINQVPEADAESVEMFNLEYELAREEDAERERNAHTQT